MIPIDESEQSKGIKAGLKAGRLRMVKATMDTAPTAAITQEDLKKLKAESDEKITSAEAQVQALKEENESLKKSNAGLKGALAKTKKDDK